VHHASALLSGIEMLSFYYIQVNALLQVLFQCEFDEQKAFIELLINST